MREEDWLRYGVSAPAQAQPGAACARCRTCAASASAGRPTRRSARSISPSRTPSLRQAGDRGRAESPRATATGRSFATFSLRIERGNRVGIVGPNGAGKTTLLNLLTGALQPDSGTRARSAPISPSQRLDQRRASLDPETTVADVLTEGRGDTVLVNGEARHVVGYMKDFLFRPEQARTPLKALSGGERGRLMLARALAQPSNLLVLDEPTNDLDLETLDLLQEMLADLSRHAASGQPRPRLPRPRRDLGDRLGRRRRLDRIRRRLFRHGGAARPRHRRQAADARAQAPRCGRRGDGRRRAPSRAAA